MGIPTLAIALGPFPALFGERANGTEHLPDLYPSAVIPSWVPALGA